MSKHAITLIAILVATSASAQHHHPAEAPSARAPSAPYSGQQAREIKSLSVDEQRAWTEGQGAGLAKPAELNSHPGPMHVLEHSAELRLSASQEKETRELMKRHKAEVRALGAELVDAERQLDELFRSRRATASSVSAMTEKIGSLYARIRASHLVTHLEQTRILRPEQIVAYDRLRGYTR